MEGLLKSEWEQRERSGEREEKRVEETDLQERVRGGRVTVSEMRLDYCRQGRGWSEPRALMRVTLI